MMQAPAALPLHLMLTMMQSNVYPGAWGSSSAPWQRFLPDWLRPKTPFEKGVEQLQEMQQKFSDAGLAWLRPPQNDVGRRSSATTSQRRHPRDSLERRSQRGDPALGESRVADAPHWIGSEFSSGSPFSLRSNPAFAGMTSCESPFTDFLPHFLQPEFLTALSEKAFANSAGFMAGMQAYLTSDYARQQPNYPVRWQRGSARLLDLAPDNVDGLAVLMVPSLINQSYVLDLYPEASLAQYLKAQGFRPLILDWGAPGDDERSFTTADYITNYGIGALEALREHHQGPIALLGYCMGGVFALAMTQIAQLYVDALVLLATPWDFSSDDTPSVLLQPATQSLLRNWIRAQNPVPSLVTQTVFHLIDPWRIQEKYSRYPDLSETEKQHFLAVEQWVNDGIPLVQKVAEECFVDWPQGNILAKHQWKVNRRWIEPNAITCPTLAIIPTRDKIVPIGCAMPLTAEIPRCDILKPETGHIGMVVGRRAKATVWKPLAQWLRERF